METASEQLERVHDQYRRAAEGHVFIQDTLDAFLETVAARIGEMRTNARVLELGSHAGFITQMLIARWPSLEIAVADGVLGKTEPQAAMEREAKRATQLMEKNLESFGR